MSTFNVTIDVNLHLSKSTEDFVMGLINGFSKPEPKPELKPETKPELKPETKPEPKPEPKPETKPEPKPEPKSSIKIDDIRKLLQQKVTNHRADIKNKLSELGAPSVTKLDEGKYEEMYNFLNSLD